MKKSSFVFFVAAFSHLFLTSCEFHAHGSLPPIDPFPPIEPLPPEPPHYEDFQDCFIEYSYRRNVAHGAIEPYVTCTVRDARSYADAVCSLEFRARGLDLVFDRTRATADFFGNANLTASNGNCYSGEIVILHAECSVDGKILDVLDTGSTRCGG